MGRVSSIILILITVAVITSCRSRKQKVDLILYNAHVYTVDSTFSVKDCIVINSEIIVDVGTKKEMFKKYNPKDSLDLNGKYIYPGFIDAHCHLYGYAVSKMEADLSGTTSFDSVIQKLKAFQDDKKTLWLKGRGWDQNDWIVKEFPDKVELDSAFPDLPVLITRIDGHAALANSKALQLAGITKETIVEGGTIEVKNNQLTGIVIDNAIERISKIIPAYSDEEISAEITNAAHDCFEVGLTTVADAGLDKKIIHMIDSLQKKKSLKMKVYVMMNPTEENFNTFMYFGRYKTPYLNVRSIKLYADGALGSRGACLLKPYADDTANVGLMVSNTDSLTKICLEAYKYGYQVNTHAIGDSAVRSILDIYSEVLKGKNDCRWRIEHSQVVHPDDLDLFKENNIIPSVNMVHATSDMYWAAERLGDDRITFAYAYKNLLETNGWFCNGSDFPIENINPVHGFYAAVFRKDLKGFPEGGFQMENAVSRIDALKAMTIWAAKALFEEREKGSIEAGKFADMVVLDKDILSIPEAEIPDVKVLMTFVNGEKVYERKESSVNIQIQH